AGPGAAAPALGSDLGLRGAPGVLETLGTRVPELSRDRSAAGRLRAGDGVHARRAPAGHGAPVLRVLGLPGDGLLRDDQPLRLAGGLPVLRRLPAPARDR